MILASAYEYTRNTAQQKKKIMIIIMMLLDGFGLMKIA